MFEVGACVCDEDEREAEKADGDERVARAGAPQHTSRERSICCSR